MQNAELTSLFQAGSILAGSSKVEGATDLKTVLASRLSQYFQTLGQECSVEHDVTLESVQLRTAQESLSVVERAQSIFIQRKQNGAGPNDSPDVVGTRDLAQIRTLLSIVFNWAVKPLLAGVVAAIPTVTPGARRRTDVNIIDLTTVPEDFGALCGILTRLLKLVLPRGVQGSVSPTIIANVFLDKHFVDLLQPCMVLGWLPKSAASDSVAPVDSLRSPVVHLLNLVPPARSIPTLTALLSDPSSLPYVKKSCSYLLTRQLLRADGVRGMLSALFSEEELSGEDAALEKLEHVARLLKSRPVGVLDEDYSRNIIAQLLAILAADPSNTPVTHKRAASFTLSRLLTTEGRSQHPAASRILLSELQQPFLRLSPAHDTTDRSQPHEMSVLDTVRILKTLLVNTDPSPVLISSLLTPVIPSLFTLLCRLEKVKITNPILKETVRGLLRTWGRIIETSEGIATIWLIIEGEGGDWKVDIAGEMVRTTDTEASEGLGLFTPDDLKRAEEAGDMDIDANILNLRPDPAQFVSLLKSMERTDIVSQIFVRLLDAYRETKAVRDADPTRTLVYLQIIMKLQSGSDTSESPLSILKQSDQLLAFIKHALQSAREQHTTGPSKAAREAGHGLTLSDLRIVEPEDEEDTGGDSDDEDESDADEELTSTALNLLLAVLEANPELSTQNAPILDEIFALLEFLAKEASETIKPLAREARMVLVARLASSSIPKKKSNPSEDSPERQYQKALKLLQDPILPVRAHGLLLLREVVSSKRTPSGELQKPQIDHALVPGILSIFLQSIQDDDSYIFLNAVQGLAAMVDGFGKDVLKGLVEMYFKGLDGIAGGALKREDVDTRTRVGEALGQVIRRCGDALPDYADILVPPLFAVVRGSHLPTALRASSLSLLALIASTSPLAAFPYATDLVEAMVDLLQVESAPVSTPVRHSDRSPPARSGDEDKNDEDKKPWRADTSEFTPTTTNSKLPPLRRAALHFLSLMLRAYASQVENTSVKAIYVLPPTSLKRIRLTAGYVGNTDEDSIARVMAREVVEDVDTLAEAMLDL